MSPLFRILLCTLALAAPVGSALAGPASASPARDKLLEAYAAEAKRADPAFAGFSAERGRALYLGPHSGGTAGINACAGCHTPDPTQVGHHAKTGREIAPMAVRVNAERFTDPDKVEKRFSRDCPSILGRDCTARDKGDFIRFLTAQ